jgi:sigma-E factor negative regulatory protein RseA
MTDRIREQVSALLDGELQAGEIGLLVRRMERDAELRRAFASYTLASEVLRAPGGVTASPGFAARVGAAIDSGSTAAPAPVVRTVPGARWARPAVAAAIAAGAALVAVVLVRPEAPEGTAVARLETEHAGPAQALVDSFPIGSAASPTPAQSQRLAGYLVAHSQFATPIGRRNVWSGVLAADPAITRVAYDVIEGP